MIYARGLMPLRRPLTSEYRLVLHTPSHANILSQEKHTIAKLPSDQLLAHPFELDDRQALGQDVGDLLFCIYRYNLDAERFQ